MAGGRVVGHDGQVITADDFRALARSSPWLWRSIELVWNRGPRVWLDRTGREVVLDGDELVRRSESAGRGRSILTLGAGPDEPAPQPHWQFVSAAEPRRRVDGLVAARDFGFEVVQPDQPLVSGYFSVAALDPVELADAVDLTELQVTQVRGRETWVARCRARSDYEPRCGCCALLPNDELARLEWGVERAGAMTWPDSVRIGLDRGTGVMTRWEPDGGDQPAVEVQIVDVDGDFDAVWRRAREE